MARKRSGRSGGGGRRSKAFKSRSFRATCRSCGIVTEVPVRPPPGVALYCVPCNAKARDNAPASPARAT